MRPALALAACLLPLSLLSRPTLAQAPERLEAKVATTADPAQQYAVFEPKDARPDAPILIVLDPRGRAIAARDFALDGARARGWRVLSSWQSRSDSDEAITGRAIDALLQEARRIAPKARVYLAGMSGTAKTLWVVAPKLRGRVAGLMGSAGGRPPGLPPLAKDALPFYGFTGMADFNHREMFALDAALDTVGTPHRLAVYAGGHGWPPEEGFSDAIAWFDLQAMRAGTLPKDAAFIQARFAACKQAIGEGIDALERAHTAAGCVRDFDGLVDVAALRADALALGASTEAKRLRMQDETLANDERRYLRRVDAWRQRFGRRFVEGIEQPPLPLSESLRQLTVATLKKKAADSDQRVAASAQRQLAWAHVAAAFYMPAYFEGRGDHNRAVALQEVADATAWSGD